MITKHTIGTRIAALKDGESIFGNINDIFPEMQYEIITDDGDLRTVDHAHINFEFGDKVILKTNDDPLNYTTLKNKVWCLLGFDDMAFSVVEWERKGKYRFEYFKGNVNDILEKMK